MPLTELGYLPKKMTPGAAGYDSDVSKRVHCTATDKTKDPIGPNDTNRTWISWTNLFQIWTSRHL